MPTITHSRTSRQHALRPARRRRRRLRKIPLTYADKRMTTGMVDRLFWRAGFGPTAADRARWTGKRVASAVDWMLKTDPTLIGPPPNNNGVPLAPTASDTDLVLEWLDRMVRADNPLPERLTLFWHGHFANNRNDVTAQMIFNQIGLLRSSSNFAINPNADVRTLMQQITIDPAMLRFLTGEANVKGRPNENYAREVMELYCLGITAPDGSPNYSEDDVKELARALSGWRINTANPAAPFAFFTPARWDAGVKTFLGHSGAFNTEQAIDIVLSHPNHPQYLMRKLWTEFVGAPPEPAMLADLVGTYVRRGRRLRPVVRKILTSRALFTSIGEPTVIKPPIVYTAGAMRSLGTFVTNGTPRTRMQSMQQEPYFPPDVSGWEGGAAWLDTNTAVARFRTITDVTGSTVTGQAIDATDVANETPQQAYDRAFEAVNRPWLASDTRTRLLDYATRAPAGSISQRRTRQRVLRSLMLGGPDGQVM